MLSRIQWIVIGVLIVGAVFAYDLTTRKTSNQFPGISSTSSSQLGSAEPTGGIDKTSWKTYTPTNDRFQVLFPSVPQHVSETHPKGANYTKYDVYLAQERDGSVFMVSMTQYPAVGDPNNNASGDDDLLDSVMKSAMKANPANQLVNSERSTFMNVPCLDFSIKNNDFSIRTKAFLVEKTLFVLTVMDRNASHLESDFNTFVGSFMLKSSPVSAENQVKAAV